jgi:ATP-dependent DNA helicase Q1
LDNRIETLENQAFLPPQHQQQQHQEQQQQQLHQMSSSMSMNETLTDPSTQLTQTQQPAFHNDDDEVDYFRQESHPPASTRTSIAGALPPLDFTQVSSTRRPRISTKVEQQEEEDDLSLSLRQITHTLQDTFHIQSFRETQQNVIQATLSGQDCFVIMRTVGGKSLTYQLPAVLELPKVTLVISPLLSLIQDQQDQMNSFLPQSCVSFTSGMGQAMHTQNWQRVRDPNGGVAMVLVTPEKVTKSSKLKSELQKLHQQNRLGRIVIDECHCACQWGHDFRPDYAKLGILKTQFPTVPILAVTATASERVRNDCSNILRLHQHYRFFRSTANRPNLIYQVRPKDTSSDVLEDMTSFIKEHHTNAAGIIYTYSKKDANTVAEELCGQGIVAEAYHSE